MRAFLILSALLVGCSSSPPPVDDSPVAETSVAPERAAPEPIRHVEGRAGFSWEPPGGWNMITTQESPYYVAQAPAEDGFVSNINISPGDYSGDMETYFQLSVDQLKAMYPEMVFETQDTTRDVPKLVTVNEFEPGIQIRQFFYFHNAPERSKVYVMVCTQDAMKPSLEAECDRSADSFKLQDIVAPKAWYSVDIPQGWTKKEDPSMQDDMYVNATTGFSLVINRTPFEGSVDDFEKAAQIDSYLTVSSTDTFDTAAGEAKRLTGMSVGNPEIEQRIYFVGVPGSVIMMVCTKPPNTTEMELCEKAVSSFSLLP